MSAVTTETATEPGVQPVKRNYLNNDHSISSWLLTGDHKRIAVLYLISISLFFFLGSLAAALIRIELTSPRGVMLESETYNKMFSAHGVIMVFFFLVPSIPATLGNFLIPLMIGARDLAFPRLNLFSWYLYVIGGCCFLSALMMGGVDAGWTFYTPFSSIYSNSQISLALIGIFIAGFSSIATGINFIVTIHKMRAPGMTWDAKSVDDRGRGARMARRDEGAYCKYVTEEQRSQPGCIGREGDRLIHSRALKFGESLDLSTSSGITLTYSATAELHVQRKQSADGVVSGRCGRQTAVLAA